MKNSKNTTRSNISEDFKVINFVGRNKAERLASEIENFYLDTLHEIKYEGILTEEEVGELEELLLKAFNKTKFGIREFYKTIEHQYNAGNLSI